MNIATVLIVVAVLALLLVRRFLGEPLEVRRLVAPPLILIAFGGYTLAHVDFPAVAKHAVLDGVVLGTGALIAVLGGLLRGLTVRVFVRDGHVWYRYTWLTLAVWGALIVLRVGQSFGASALGVDTGVTSAALMLIVGLSLLGEAAIIGRRAIATGAPFAPQGSRRVARAEARR